MTPDHDCMPLAAVVVPTLIAVWATTLLCVIGALFARQTLRLRRAADETSAVLARLQWVPPPPSLAGTSNMPPPGVDAVRAASALGDGSRLSMSEEAALLLGDCVSPPGDGGSSTAAALASSESPASTTTTSRRARARGGVRARVHPLELCSPGSSRRSSIFDGAAAASASLTPRSNAPVPPAAVALTRETALFPREQGADWSPLPRPPPTECPAWDTHPLVEIASAMAAGYAARGRQSAAAAAAAAPAGAAADPAAPGPHPTGAAAPDVAATASVSTHQEAASALVLLQPDDGQVLAVRVVADSDEQEQQG
jgi:hypothetical protein